MPWVRFTASPKLPRDWADKPYREGWEGEMSQDEADRWVRRSVAIEIDRPKKAAKQDPAPEPPVVDLADDPGEFKAEPEPPSEIPEDWRQRHHMVRIGIARHISGKDVANAHEADEIIAAEVERRTAEKTIEHHSV